MSEQKSRSGLAWLSKAEEKVGGRVRLWALSGMGKHATSLDLAFDCVPESRAGGKTMRKTDIKMIRCNLCLKGRITGGFPSCLSAAQFNFAVI